MVVAVTVTAHGGPEHSDARPSAQAARAPRPSLARHRSYAQSLSRFRIPKRPYGFRSLTRFTVESAAEQPNPVQFSRLRQRLFVLRPLLTCREWPVMHQEADYAGGWGVCVVRERRAGSP